MMSSFQFSDPILGIVYIIVFTVWWIFQPRFSGSVKLLALLLVLVVIAGCEERNESATKGSIAINVDESIAPAISMVVDEFTSLYTDAQISKETVSTREAIANLINEEVSLILIARELTPEERESFDRFDLKIYSYNIAMDGIVLLVNPKNSIRQIDMLDVQKIMSGEITNWKDVKTSMTSGKIQMFSKDRNSADYTYMTKNLLYDINANINTYPCSTSTDVIAQVAKYPNAFGWIGLGWKPDSKNLDVRILEVAAYDSTAIVQNYYEPHQAHIHRRYYPLARNLYVYSRDMGNSNVTAGLVTFFTHEGQRIILNKGLVPSVYPVRLIQYGTQ
jgi:phosphate transport system substrate-binding protein